MWEAFSVVLDTVNISYHCYRGMIFEVECKGTEPVSRILKNIQEHPVTCTA